MTSVYRKDDEADRLTPSFGRQRIYNLVGLHSALGYLSATEFELQRITRNLQRAWMSAILSFLRHKEASSDGSETQQPGTQPPPRRLIDARQSQLPSAGTCSLPKRPMTKTVIVRLPYVRAPLCTAPLKTIRFKCLRGRQFGIRTASSLPAPPTLVGARLLIGNHVRGREGDDVQGKSSHAPQYTRGFRKEPIRPPRR